ncbi:MAG: hypothetical protein KDD45_06085, partial [Bdellovibrionales bacterium]|nr:hypothetical protein [Bdellovibrionales bacterium]
NKQKATKLEIKNYFIHKKINANMLHKISKKKKKKMEENIKNQKIKMIYKEKARRFHVHRKYESGNSVASAKSSSKTNSWSEEDQ